MVALRFESDGFEPFVLLLDRFRQALEHPEPVLTELATYQKEVVNARVFAQQGSAETGRWVALSPRYAAWKAKVRPGRPILVFDGDLRETMTSARSGIFEVWDKGFTVGTDLPYARYHQDGTPTMPARPILGRSSKADNRRMAKILQEFVINGGS
jgi:phage gpG-like protein